jgi:hypothetical protein
MLMMMRRPEFLMMRRPEFLMMRRPCAAPKIRVERYLLYYSRSDHPSSQNIRNNHPYSKSQNFPTITRYLQFKREPYFTKRNNTVT